MDPEVSRETRDVVQQGLFTGIVLAPTNEAFKLAEEALVQSNLTLVDKLVVQVRPGLRSMICFPHTCFQDCRATACLGSACRPYWTQHGRLAYGQL